MVELCLTQGSWLESIYEQRTKQKLSRRTQSVQYSTMQYSTVRFVVLPSLLFISLLYSSLIFSLFLSLLLYPFTLSFFTLFSSFSLSLSSLFSSLPLYSPPSLLLPVLCITITIMNVPACSTAAMSVLPNMWDTVAAESFVWPVWKYSDCNATL